MLNNKFIQAAGVALIIWLIFRSGAVVLYSIASATRGLADWVRFSLVPWSEEAAIAIGIIYLVLAAVFSGRDN